MLASLAQAPPVAGALAAVQMQCSLPHAAYNTRPANALASALITNEIHLLQQQDRT